MKNWCVSLAKIALAAGIIALIFWKKVDPGDLAVRLREIDLRLFATCGCGYGVLFAISAYRWEVLVSVQGIRARYRSLLRFSLIGVFFNNILPGSMGGDLVKAWYCTRVEPSLAAGAVSSVLADRIIGFLSLFALGFLGLAANAGTPGLREPSMVFIALFISISAALALFSQRALLSRIPRLKALLDRTAFGDSIRRFYTTLCAYRSHPGMLAKAFGISCAMQLGFILTTLGITRALGMHGVAYRHLLLLTPLIGTVAAIPVTPSGWGTMELAFCWFFPSVGVTPEQALALDLAMRAILIAWSLVGGVLYALPSRGAAAVADGLN